MQPSHDIYWYGNIDKRENSYICVFGYSDFKFKKKEKKKQNLPKPDCLNYKWVIVLR